MSGVVVSVQDQSKTEMRSNGKVWVGIEADDGLATEFADNVKQFGSRGFKYGAVKEPPNAQGLVVVHLNKDFPSTQAADKANQELRTVSRDMLKGKIIPAMSKQTVKQAEVDVTVPSEDKLPDVQKIVAAHKLELKPVDQ